MSTQRTTIMSGNRLQDNPCVFAVTYNVVYLFIFYSAVFLTVRVKLMHQQSFKKHDWNMTSSYCSGLHVSILQTLMLGAINHDYRKMCD